ncbi:glycosyltransferase [Methylopila sp. M107]|uniref:glycosyltransferase n=1 Tax=Methylopila sp. M107 TaxID=1101190 RepID=UPI00039C11A1|nr:glycosyltransferase [Methylopila sp. M107]
MTSSVLSSLDPVQKIRLEIDGETKSIPLYASLATRAQVRLEQKGSGVGFQVSQGETPRITQFGNRPTSRQPQNTYAFRLPGSKALRVDIARGAGEYGRGCELCLQLYGPQHGFLTQFRLPLSDASHRFEAKLPKDAAHGCFSVQLSGSGVLADLSVRMSLKGFGLKSGLAIAEDGSRADELQSLLRAARQDESALAQLRRSLSAHPRPVISSVSRWHAEGAHSRVVELMRLAAQWRETDEIAPITAQLLYWSARSLSNLNATKSAIAAFDELLALEGWRDHLNAAETQAVFLHQGKALIRNGRVEEGLAAFNAARLNDPMNWEAYFLLANNLDEQDGPLKDAYYQAAQALRDAPNAKLAAAVVENELKNDRWGSALSKALEALAKLQTPNDIWLALGNVYLQAGDAASWRRYAANYFEQFALSAPTFDSGEDGARFPPTSPPPPAQSADRGLVAVIMTTYNSAATLEQAARSVLAQSYTRIALVIVDDASSDDTTAIAETLVASDARVSLIRNPTNAGTYACKNIALNATQAEYYTFHDSDDWMHPQHVARHLDVMEDREAACTTSLWFRMELDGRAVTRHSGGYQHANPASMFIRRDVLETVGYFDNVRTGADTEFFWRIRSWYPQEQIIEIAQPLAIGLSHDASLTQSGATAFNKHRFSAVRLAYWESWVRWHIDTLSSDGSTLRLPFEMQERPFWAPPEIASVRDEPDGDVAHPTDRNPS